MKVYCATALLECLQNRKPLPFSDIRGVLNILQVELGSRNLPAPIIVDRLGDSQCFVSALAGSCSVPRSKLEERQFVKRVCSLDVVSTIYLEVNLENLFHIRRSLRCHSVSSSLRRLGTEFVSPFLKYFTLRAVTRVPA
jgi:hypothetical protein